MPVVPAGQGRAIGRLAAGVATALLLFTGATSAGDNLDLPIRQFGALPEDARALAPDTRARDGWKKELKAAREAWRRGRFTAARKAFQRAAAKGSIVAAWYLGHIYRLGRGAKRDDEKAFRNYRRVALAYDADETNRMRLMMTVDALVRVADYYRNGIGRRKARRDPRRAFRLYNIAAGHGHPAAFYGLGVLALEGRGMRRHPRRAVGWLTRAARLGYVPAAILLGDLARSGLKGYIRKDEVAALSWYMIAARRTDARRDPALFRRIAALSGRLDEAARRRAGMLADTFYRAAGGGMRGERMQGRTVSAKRP